MPPVHHHRECRRAWHRREARGDARPGLPHDARLRGELQREFEGRAIDRDEGRPSARRVHGGIIRQALKQSLDTRGEREPFELRAFRDRPLALGEVAPERDAPVRAIGRIGHAARNEDA